MKEGGIIYTNTLDRRTNYLIRKRLFQVCYTFLMVAAVLFLSAGTLNWIWACVYLGIGVMLTFVATPILIRVNPQVIAERAEIKTGTKRFDRIFSFYSLVFTLAMLVACGLDFRFGWTTGFPLYFHLFGAVLYTAGTVLFYWAMTSNQFFSRSVRIQDERQHRVADNGPYRYVRHPGYSGMILSLVGTPLLLGSPWAFIPGLMVIVGYAFRTALEDRTLQDELKGYPSYTKQVQYRLLPGIW